VIGNIEVVDKPCRALANASRCVVASTQYRRGPETEFPRPVEDCCAATSWLPEHAGDLGADPAKVAVGGDSAGDNLTAVALIARDRGGPRLAYPRLRAGRA
jgi:acetyl esterase